MGKKNESTGQLSESSNIFQIIYHSIKDLIEAGEHDIFNINGKIFFLIIFVT